MTAGQPRSCTAFADTDLLAAGDVREVASACKRLVDATDTRRLLVFDDETAELVELDLRGSERDVLDRYAGAATASAATASAATAGAAGAAATTAASVTGADDATAPSAPRPPGRPKLGVVGREVTLLPRHWEWLNAQPGGASVALRKLVEQARKANEGKDRVRRSKEVTFRFISAMAGNERGFEEASRALFAGDRARFEEQSRSWPPAVRDCAVNLAEDAFGGE